MQERIGKTSLWVTVVMPFAMAFFIGMAFKCINAILAHPLMAELNLSNVEVGWITSVFLLSFAVMQLPLGVLLDHWGPRKTQALLFVVGAAGITIFALASDATMLAVGRAILGIGMAGGLMAAFKATAEWCKGEDIPFYNGVILGVGGLGALMVTTPAKYFELEFGWRALCFLMAVLTLIVAAVVFFAARDKPQAKGGEVNLHNDVAGLKSIYTDPFFCSLRLWLRCATALLLPCSGYGWGRGCNTWPAIRPWRAPTTCSRFPWA